MRSFLIGALVLSLPLVARLPATAGAFASNAWWLPWAPPAWFVGLERWLIGDASRAALAAEAAIGTVVVLIVSVASYVLLYRRFDRVTVQSSPSQNSGRPGSFAGQVERPCAGPTRHRSFRVDHDPAERPASGPRRRRCWPPRERSC